MTTAERALKILVEDGNYRVLENPVRVGSQDFDFLYVLTATGKSNDLVIIVELTGGSDSNQVARSILAFTRALDVYKSRRSVTVVFTSGQAEQKLINAINRVCRVLPVGSANVQDPMQYLRDWLAVLLPIKSPPPVEHLADWNSMLQQKLQNVMSPEIIEQFVALGISGKESVEEAFAEQITIRADRALEERDET